MRRPCLHGALWLLLLHSASAAINVDRKFIAVPGGMACPRDCNMMVEQLDCKAAGVQLGLPCQNDKAANTEKTAAIAALGPNQMYEAIMDVLGIELHGTQVHNLTHFGDLPAGYPTQGHYHGLAGTELTQISYIGGGGSRVFHTVSNKTDESIQSIIDIIAPVPAGTMLRFHFSGGCNAKFVPPSLRKTTMGGCSWGKDTGLRWNPYREQGGLRDVMPFQQKVVGKKAVAGEGAAGFRICQCSILPKFVSVMHAQCAPSCRRDYDPCTQHQGCKRIKSWDTCKLAGDSVQWFPRSGANAGPGGKSVPDLLSEWNTNFDGLQWRVNRGVVGNNDPASSTPCPAAGLCLSNPIWGDSEWTAGSGLNGGMDRFCEFVNDTAGFAATALDNNRWFDSRVGAYKPLPPPSVNFLADNSRHVIPQAPEWSQYWTAPQGFLDGTYSTPTTRPEGCTFDPREELPVFYPWNTLRLRDTPHDLTAAQCCPPGTYGTSCFVENCTLAPCVDLGGGACDTHKNLIEDMFEICECDDTDIITSFDECVYYGNPCGAGQTCSDPTPTLEPVLSSPRYQCTCNGDTKVGQPADCGVGGPTLKYMIKPAGRDCGECSRVVSPTQCEAAAAALGLADQTHTEDPPSHRWLRPCGCHYSEHGQRCTGNSQDCLRFNPVHGDGVYDGCDAYEVSDAHDFLICACNETLPKYVAEAKGTCRAAEGCQTIVSKVDCRDAAESIGMHLAVNEEKEALLLLGTEGHLSKNSFNDYIGLDGNTYQHDDDGLGPVVGDGAINRATRPPGCHYRRRFDADVLPDGATVNWPHLLFNPMLNSTVLATTQDMAICQCGGAPLAPTPAPTADNAAFALSQGLLPVGNGMCAFASGAPVVREVSFVSTFHTCASHCASVSDCRGVEWFVDAADTVDREGLGRCTPIRICSLASQPCEPLTTAPAPADTSCYDRPPPTPAPTPAPTALTHLGDVCQSFCCQQTNRADCCGDKCDLGANGSYCWWSAKNECERNCYPREGPCMDIEICFNATEISPLNDSAFGKQVAKDTNLLLGSDAGSVDLISVSYLNGTDILVVKLRCPDGGCGSKQFAVEELCFSGQDIPTFGPEATRVAVNGKCMHVPGGVLTEDAPKADLGGRQPVRVTASDCRCEPVLQDVGLTWDTNLNQWVTQQVQHTPVLVTSSTLSPAWLDSPPVNTLVNIPEAYMGLTQFRMNHSAPFGAQFNISCPPGCSLCDVFIMHYHQPPCSSDTNGGWPALLPDDGWIPASCAPRMTDGQTQWPMVAYWRRIEGGKHVVTPPVETACLKYFTIFAGPGSYCEDNSLNTEAACKKVGGLCMWRDGECRATWCPPRQTLAPGAPPGVGTETKPHTPVQCVPPPGLQCENPVGQAAREAALSQLNPAVSGGYGVLHAGKECLSDDAYLGTEDSIADCAAACARASSCKYFIYGTGPKSGLCYHELTTDACATEGFESDHYLFAQLTNVPAEQTGTF